MSYSILGIHLLHYHVVFRSLSQADYVVSSVQHRHDFPPTQTLCREHVIHNHPYGVNFNDSVCCLSHPMGSQRLIYFLSRVGFTFATDLSIFTGTKVYAKIPKSSTSIIPLCKGAYQYHSNLYWATRYLSVKYVTSAAKETFSQDNVAGTSKHCLSMTLKAPPSSHSTPTATLISASIGSEGRSRWRAASDFIVNSPSGTVTERAHTFIGTRFV